MLGNLRLLVAAVALSLGVTLLPALDTGPADSPGAASAAAAAGSDRFVVRVASFNILSSSMRSGGIRRAHRAAVAVQKTESRVVAFQEVAANQLRVLRKRMPGYRFWPRRKFGTRGSAIQLAWKKSLYKPVHRGKIYRPFLRHQRPIPYVKLRDRRTGRKFFAIAIHNSPGGHERERDISTRKEIKLIRRMQQAGKKRLPIFVLGDMNERVEFCNKVRRNTRLWAMNATRGDACPVPPGGPDWMLGTRKGVSYQGFRKRKNGISDHPLLTARALVTASRHPAWHR